MRRGCLPLLLIAAWTLWAAGPADSQEWTRFRGPEGSGIGQAEGIPLDWTIKSCNWRVELPGIGYSSPVLWGDRIFITCTIEEDATRIIRCLRTSDGGLIWEKSYPSKPHSKHKFNCHASSSPVVDEHNVYIVWATPENHIVVALDQEKGSELWRRDLGPFIANHGFGASPIVFEDSLILTADRDEDSFVTALDCKTGKTLWKSAREKERAAYATPFIFRGADKNPQLILSSSAHGINSLDPLTGKSNWEVKEFKMRVVGSPMTTAGLIIGGCGGGGSGKQMVAVRPGDASGKVKPEVAYDIKGSLPYVPIPVANGKLLFLWNDQGVVTCLEVSDGKMLWRERIGGTFFGSPVLVGERIYCISRDGEMIVLAAADKYKLLAKINLEEPSNSTPAVAGGVMYIRTVSHLMAIGGKK